MCRILLFAGCDSQCQIEAGYACKNRIRETSLCRIGCGNGVYDDASEGCDDNNTMNGDGCSEHCAVERGFSCVSSSSSNSNAASVCHPGCGDGQRQTWEQCDDGGNEDNDGKGYTISTFFIKHNLMYLPCMLSSPGCSSACVIEPGWSCHLSDTGADVCELCGNGILEGSETCDDNNLDSNDGCSKVCRIEPGFTCVQNMASSVSQCYNCGNGRVEHPETCDDMNQVDLDGCDTNCQLETGYTCSHPHGNSTIGASKSCLNGSPSRPSRFPSGLYGFPDVVICPKGESISIHILDFDVTGSSNAEGKYCFLNSMLQRYKH
jgi:cysteine-rich repeat protein